MVSKQFVDEWIWPPGCRWMPSHKMRLTDVAKMILEDLPEWHRDNRHGMMVRGVTPGYVCERCGMSQEELLQWPEAQCLPRGTAFMMHAVLGTPGLDVTHSKPNRNRNRNRCGKTC